MEIINHSVKIRNLELLLFFYPSFIILNEPVLFSDRPIIFTGDSKYINQIKSLGVDYIFITELAEYNLNDRMTLLEFVFSKYKKKVPKYLLQFYEDLDEKTFINQIKYFWITGKWKLKEYNKSGIFLELLQSFKTDTFRLRFSCSHRPIQWKL